MIKLASKLDFSPFLMGVIFGGVTPETQVRLIDFAWRSGATVFGSVVGFFVLMLIKKYLKK